MSELIRLRRHIKSIQTTKKITYAMRLISMSLYSKLERFNQPLTNYQQNLYRLFYRTMNYLPEWDNPVLFPKDILNTTPLIIFAASSKALCGSFNSNLIRYFKRYFFAEEHQSPTFITIGQKATSFIKEEGVGPISASYNDFNYNNFLILADELTKLISSTQPPYSSVTFFSNYFKNFFRQLPQKTILIPIDRQKLKKKLLETETTMPISLEDDVPMIWEQSIEETLHFLATHYIKSSIHHLLFQSLVSEQASRFVAMDNATTNANNLLERLALQYNKSRQTIITKELIELAASYE